MHVELKLLLRSRVVRDTGWSFGLKIASTGLSFLLMVFLARLLDAKGYGIYAYAFALVTLLALPAQAGLPNLVMRETARGIAHKRPELVRGIWVWAGRLTGGLSLMLMLGASITLFLCYGRQWNLKTWTMAWAFILVPLVTLGNLRGAALRGLNRIVAGQFPEFVIRPGLFLLLVGSLSVLAGGQFTPARAMALHVLATAVAFGVGACMLWRNAPFDVRQARPRFEGKAWLASMLPLAFLTGMEIVNNQASILILGIFQPVEQAGVYRVAMQVARIASFGLFAVGVVVAPRFATLYAQGEMARLQRLATASARVVLAFNLVATLFFVVFGNPLLGIVFGPAFVASYTPLLILLGGQFVNSAVGFVGYLLNMTGHEWEAARGVAIVATINIVLNLVLIPILGTKGAAMATTVSMFMWNVLLWQVVRKKLGINSLAFHLGAVRAS